MGGCASKPKDLDIETVPAPDASAEAPITIENAKAKTVAQEVKDGDETKEKPLVDVGLEPAPEAPKIEEATTTEEKPATEEVVPVEVKPTKAAEEAKELPKEEKKEMADA